MQRAQKEAKLSPKEQVLAGTLAASLFIHIENEYQGVPVVMKGELKATTPTRLHASLRKTSESALAANTAAWASENPAVGCQKSCLSAVKLHSACSSHVELLEVFSYDKKSAAVIRHVLTAALDSELSNLEGSPRISLSISVFSSKRYLESVVAALNDLLERLSLPTKYYFDKKVEEDAGKPQSTQITVRSSRGKAVYSVWTCCFQPPHTVE